MKRKRAKKWNPGFLSIIPGHKIEFSRKGRVTGSNPGNLLKEIGLLKNIVCSTSGQWLLLTSLWYSFHSYRASKILVLIPRLMHI